jgi:hypothetical protein
MRRNVDYGCTLRFTWEQLAKSQADLDAAVLEG